MIPTGFQMGPHGPFKSPTTEGAIGQALIILDLNSRQLGWGSLTNLDNVHDEPGGALVSIGDGSTPGTLQAGTVMATSFIGDGSQLANLPAASVDETADYDWTGSHKFASLDFGDYGTGNTGARLVHHPNYGFQVRIFNDQPRAVISADGFRTTQQAKIAFAGSTTSATAADSVSIQRADTGKIGIYESDGTTLGKIVADGSELTNLPAASVDESADYTWTGSHDFSQSVDITGTVYSRDPSTGRRAILKGGTSTLIGSEANHNVNIVTSNSTRAIFATDGRLFIGSTGWSPSSANDRIVLNNGNTATSLCLFRRYQSSVNNDHLRIRSDGAHYQIDSGNVGGTSFPVSLAVDGVDGLMVDNDGTAGVSRFLLYDNDTSTLQRVKVGANNTGPGGAGRALYIENS